MLEWCEYSDEHKPSEQCFNHETKNYVDSFTVQIVSPTPKAFVLKNHVQSKEGEVDDLALIDDVTTRG